MKNETIRGIIALLVVGGVVLTSSILTLVPIISHYEADRAAIYSEFLKTYTGIFAGIVGLVFGYYFGKSAYVGGDAGVPNAREPNHGINTDN